VTLASETPLGPWKLDRLIGEGSLARVYSARHEASRAAAEAPYALKILRRKWWISPEAVQVLRREAIVAGRVRHANVVAVLSASLDRPPYYHVMPRLPGATLEKRLAVRGPLGAAQALWIARQVAEGLAAIHAACGMIHGDVKPANVFLSPQGRATLLDLGFARAAKERSGESISSMPSVSSALFASPAYAAPEMLTSNLVASVPSDIYSLGAVLYEMLGGRRPFEADEPARLAELVRGARPGCLGKLRPDLPRPIASLTHRMLAKDPLRRPQSHAELINELLRLEIACFASR
jgi:serine/threonine-protein kinase